MEVGGGPFPKSKWPDPTRPIPRSMQGAPLRSQMPLISKGLTEHKELAPYLAGCYWPLIGPQNPLDKGTIQLSIEVSILSITAKDSLQFLWCEWRVSYSAQLFLHPASESLCFFMAYETCKESTTALQTFLWVLCHVKASGKCMHYRNQACAHLFVPLFSVMSSPFGFILHINFDATTPSKHKLFFFFFSFLVCVEHNTFICIRIFFLFFGVC